MSDVWDCEGCGVSAADSKAGYVGSDDVPTPPVTRYVWPAADEVEFISNDGDYPTFIQRGHHDLRDFTERALRTRHRWDAEEYDDDLRCDLADEDEFFADPRNLLPYLAAAKHTEAVVCSACNPDGPAEWLYYGPDALESVEKGHADARKEAEEEFAAWPDSPTPDEALADHHVEGPFPVTVLALDQVKRHG